MLVLGRCRSSRGQDGGQLRGKCSLADAPLLAPFNTPYQGFH